MKKILIQYGVCALAIITAVSVTPSQAQIPAQSVQAALSQEAGTLSDKFTGLARVMAGKYDWKPGQGVRSVGDVFNLIVAENGYLARTLTGAAGERPAPITDPEKLQKVFGKDMTKEGAVRYLFGDQHEHLGQSIAYARSNGVVPPWSK
jgi:hypothetical protein